MYFMFSSSKSSFLFHSRFSLSKTRRNGSQTKMPGQGSDAFCLSPNSLTQKCKKFRHYASSSATLSQGTYRFTFWQPRAGVWSIARASVLFTCWSQHCATGCRSSAWVSSLPPIGSNTPPTSKCHGHLSCTPCTLHTVLP